MLHAQKRRPAPGFKHTAGRCGQPAQTQGVHAAAALFRAAARQQSYTSVDSSTSYRTFTPQVIDISNLLGDGDATQQQVQQVQQECEATGFLAITGHGISLCQLEQLFAASRKLFDLPLEVKLQLVVKDMKAGRGYEISPEHKTYMQMCKRQLVPPGRNNKHIDSGHFVCRSSIFSIPAAPAAAVQHT